MKRYEYYTIPIETGGFSGGKVNAELFNQILNDMGNHGWELVEAVATNKDFGATRSIVCIFKRELQ